MLSNRFLHLFIFLNFAGLSAATIPVRQVSLRAVTNREQRPVIRVSRLSRPPTLADFKDMKPNPEIARQMTRLEGFIQWIPSDGKSASQKTEAYLGYDGEHLYAVYLCFDDSPGKIRARLSRREDIFRDDRVDLFLDTFDDQRRAYVFTANPFGVQADAYWIEKEGRQYDPSIDMVWQSEGELNEQGYIVLMAIPFKSLRFRSVQRQEWGIILTRFIIRSNEGDFWPYVTSRIEGRLNQSAKLTGLEGVSPGRNIQLIPYGFFRSYRALTEGESPEFARDRADIQAGLDAKMVLRDSFAVDIALNPDFNQIESDEPQITVNRRFEVYFPEKRSFFLENASYFQTPNNLVFTRRIADPQFGVKITGKTGPWAIGALVADDQSAGRNPPEEDPLFGQRAYFGIFRVNRDIGAQSTIGGIYTDRIFEDSYNRVGGVDGRVKLGRNWVTSFQAVASSTRETDGTRSAGPAYDWSLQRAGRQFNYTLEYRDRSPGFRTEVGFLPGSTSISRPGRPRIRQVPLRPDIRSARQMIGYRFRPEGEYLIAWGPDVTVNPSWDYDWRPLDLLYSLDLNSEFIGKTYAGLFYTGLHERLGPEDFETLPEVKKYSSSRTGLYFSSFIINQLGFEGELALGTLVNIVPPEGSPPVLADATEGKFQLTWFPLKNINLTGTYILARAISRDGSGSVFDNHIGRFKVNWQLDRKASIRAILHYNEVQPNPENTSMETFRNFNADVLFTYQVNSWTALYVGYNNNLRNRALYPTKSGNEIILTPDLHNDAWQLFAKFSYFLQF